MHTAHGNLENWSPKGATERQAVLDELRLIQESTHFCNSRRYPAMLRHIVEKTLDGQHCALKERTIGIELFGRTATYDTNTDTIVRFTAGEVRKRLQLYYSEQGKAARIRIALPPGSYTAEFSLGPEAAESLSGTAEPDSTAADTTATAGYPASELTVQQQQPWLRVIFRSRRTIAIMTIILLLLVGGGVFFCSPRQTHEQDILRQFWAPALQAPNVVLCSGSVTFRDGNYSGVTTARKSIDYPFVSMQNVVSISRIQDTLNHLSIKTHLAFSANTPVTDLREHTVVLLGGFNNDLTVRLTEPLRFHFVVKTHEHIADNQHPNMIYERDPALSYASADDYAMVARFRDSTIDGWVFVLAGIGRNGTEAAAQFATNPHDLEQLRTALGGSLSDKNLQVLLKINVIDGKTGAPSIIAVHTWK